MLINKKNNNKRSRYRSDPAVRAENNKITILIKTNNKNNKNVTGNNLIFHPTGLRNLRLSASSRTNWGPPLQPPSVSCCRDVWGVSGLIPCAMWVSRTTLRLVVEVISVCILHWILYTLRNLFEILWNQLEIRFYWPFFDWFGSKRTSAWFQINRKMVNTI